MGPDTSPSQPPLSDFKEQVRKLEEKGEHRGYWLEMPADEVKARKKQMLPFLADSLGASQEEVDEKVELDTKKLVVFGASHEKVSKGISILLNQSLEVEKTKRGLEYLSLTVNSTSLLGPDHDIPAGEVFVMRGTTQLVSTTNGEKSKARMSLPLSLHEDVVSRAVDETRNTLDLLGSAKVTAYKNTL